MDCVQAYRLYHERHPLQTSTPSPCFVCWDDFFPSSILNCEDDHCSKLGIHRSCFSMPERIDGHPFHPEHPLILHSKPPYDSRTFMCHACGRISWAFTYHCDKCHFDLHVSCASLRFPYKIQHPSHAHPLILCKSESWDRKFIYSGGTLSWAFTYHCDKCQFDLHVSCASLGFPYTDESQKEKYKIQQPSHPHPLILCENQNWHGDSIAVPCSGCKQQFKGRSSMYVCIHCHCFLHESCADYPSQIKHSFHLEHPLTLLDRPSTDSSRCNACGNSAKGFVFHCSECKFGLDLFCASLMPAQNCVEVGRELQIQQLKHPHPLILCENKKNPDAICSICKQPFGGREIYVCLHCNCCLDESCARWPGQIKHPFHPKHPLTQLIQSEYNSSRCRACWKRMRGLTFHCSECQFGVGVCCASFMPSHNSQDRELQVQQLGHPHPLVLYKKETNFHFVCYACRRSFKDSFYVCFECGILLHRSCANLSQKIQCSLYHDHCLSLVEHPPPLLEECLESILQLEESLESNRQFVWLPEMHRYHPKYDPDIIPPKAASLKTKGKANMSDSHLQSNVCEASISGFVYTCSTCADEFNVRSTIQYQLHEHRLAFFDIIENKLSCRICHRSLHTPFFRCEECNFNLHVSCIFILPQIVKVWWHRHNLSLTISPVKDCPWDDKNSEFYCDVCEQTRELSDPTYKCEDCSFVAHVHCVVTEVQRFNLLVKTQGKVEEWIYRINTFELRVLVEEWSLPFKLEDTKPDMSSSVHEKIAGKRVSKTLMIKEIEEQVGSELPSGAGVDESELVSSFSLIELDISKGDLEKEKACLKKELKAISNKMNECERRLKELAERRATEFQHLFEK